MGYFLQGAIALYLVTKAIYNFRFHPLAKYPGPSSWIISRIPYLICLNQGQLPFRIKQLHDKYGPIIRVGADELSFNTPLAWKDIMTRKDMLRPSQWGSRPPGVETYNMISAGIADHARFRKALTPAYSEKSVKEYEPVIRSYFNKLITKFDGLISSGKDGYAIVDIVDWTNYATFDIIGELSWSKSYGCIDGGQEHAFMGVLLHFQAVVIGASISYYPWLNALLTKITPKSAFAMLETIFQDGHERLRARMKKETVDHSDLVSHISEYNSKSAPLDKLSDAEIEQNILAILVGGSETLTTTFSGAFHYLLEEPEKLEKLVREIRSSFASAEDISASAVAKLPYLNAVIDETLRLCPPIPDMLRRQVPTNVPATIADQVIPPGTTVSLSCYAMFKSADHFSFPESFEPARFLPDSDKVDVKNSFLLCNDMSAFHPFSMGPHNCLGQALARLEMRLLLALILYNFDIKLPKGVKPKKWTDQKIYWTWEKQPLLVEIRPA